jgi:hypothetical protein
LITLAAGLALLASTACAQEGMLSVGVRSQGTLDWEPGQDWMVGPELGYSNYDVFAHRLQFKAAYLTNRAEAVFRPNIIKQDYFLFTPQWHFRRSRLFDPIAQMDLGYSRYDIENEAIFGSLDNDTWIAAIQLGLAVNIDQGRYGLYYHLGYNLITPPSSLVFPGVFGVGFWIML